MKVRGLSGPELDSVPGYLIHAFLLFQETAHLSTSVHIPLLLECLFQFQVSPMTHRYASKFNVCLFSELLCSRSVIVQFWSLHWHFALDCSSSTLGLNFLRTWGFICKYANKNTLVVMKTLDIWRNVCQS